MENLGNCLYGVQFYIYSLFDYSEYYSFDNLQEGPVYHVDSIVVLSTDCVWLRIAVDSEVGTACFFLAIPCLFGLIVCCCTGLVLEL